jgi:RHS repeat-associated protein
VGYDAGYKRKETNRLSILEVKYNNAVVRRFWPAYATGGSGSTPRTRAASIYECGQSDTLCHDTVLFDWQIGTNTLGAEASTGQSISAGTIVHSIDANADGKSDLVYPAGGTWRVRYGQVDGTYGTETNTAISATNPSQSHSIDYSSDGFRDVIFPDGSGNWRVLQFSVSGTSEVLTGKPANGASSGLVAIQDLDGDGREDVLSASGATLKVRLNTSSGLAATETTLYTAPSGWTFDTNAFGTVGLDEYQRQRTAIDFNGDGRGDLLAKLKQTAGGAIQWKALISMGTSYTADLNLESSSTQRPLLLDVNGDGLMDALGHNGTSWVVNFARGGYDPAVRSIFDSTKAYPSITTALTEAITIDYDQDGAADVLVPSGGTWQIAYSTRESFSAPSSTGYSAPANHAARATDLDGDGLADLSYHASGTWKFRVHSGDLPDLATDFTDAFGNYASALYDTLPQQQGLAYERTAEPSFPQRRFTAALPIVHNYFLSGNVEWNFWTLVGYQNANVHLQGRGFLGFSFTSHFDSRASLRSNTTFSQTFPYIGRPTVTAQYRKDPVSLVEKKFAEVTNTWSTVTGGAGSEARSYPYVSASNTKRWEVDGAFDQAQISVATTTVTMDPYGTPYDVTTTTTEPASANGVQAGIVYTARSYTPLGNLTNDTTNWCLGQRTQVQSIRSHTGYQGTSQTRTTNQSWDAAKCRITGQTIEPGHATLQVTKSFGFDAFGNKNSETVTGIGMSARTTTTSWGATGQFPITITNALSQATTMGYDFAHGVRTSVTDPNGIQSTSVLDARGRVTRENRPDGTASTREYADCTTYTACLPSGLNRLILIDKTLNTAGATLTESWTHLDQRGRTLGVKSPTLSGAFNWVEREYDNRGLLTRQSAPCWQASCSYYWSEHSYDQLGRRTASSRPASDSDPTLVTTNTYFEGLKTRSVDPLGKQRSTTAKVIGATARSTDHNGYYQAMDHDAFLNLVRVQDSLGNTLQSGTFDLRGNRTASTDADLGSWGYAFSALGEMTSQTDANAKTTSFTWDALSRMTQRLEPEGAGSITSTFTWGVAADNTANNKYIGRLKSQSISGTGISTYSETNTFDAIGRLTQTRYSEGGNTYDVNQSYAATTGYLDTLTYPTSTSSYRLKLQYDYQNGTLLRVKDYNAPTTVFWQANTTDARNLIVNETLGNGLTTASDFDAVTARMDSIATGPGGSTTIQNLAYLWDDAGNLMQRQDNNQGLTENFYYDNLHRLDSSTLGGSTNLDVTLDDKGNVTSKSGVGTYTYHATKIHAVSSINTGGGTLSYSYDAAGNMTNRNGTTLTWYANNLPKAITKDANNSSIFEYGPGRARWKHLYKTGGTTYTHTYIGKLMEKVVTGSTTEYKHFISVKGASLALISRKSTGVNASYYRHDDHLGSTEHLTNSSGSNVVMESFGAYGQRRGTNWTGSPTSGELATINDTTRKGFTEHEMLDSTELVHMNGRVFDPVTGRFVSADLYIDGPDHTQGWNRYAYVRNGPLSATDPTGWLIEELDAFSSSFPATDDSVGFMVRPPDGWPDSRFPEDPLTQRGIFECGGIGGVICWGLVVSTGVGPDGVEEVTLTYTPPAVSVSGGGYPSPAAKCIFPIMGWGAAAGAATAGGGAAVWFFVLATGEAGIAGAIAVGEAGIAGLAFGGPVGAVVAGSAAGLAGLAWYFGGGC